MYKPGEKDWNRKMTKAENDLNHRKPFVPGVGGLLAEAGCVLSLLPPPPAKVLDAGCADGHLTHLMALAGYEVTGVDVCYDEIRWAERSFVRWRDITASPDFRVADFDRCGFFPSFDAVVFTSALHHSVDRRATLRAAFSYLKPGGKLVACEPGLGHGWTSVSRAWSKKFDVTERSTPPFAVVWDGWAVGFRQPKVYPNPVTIHKAAYPKPLPCDNAFARLFQKLPFSLAALSSLKWLHGVTVMTKPNQ